MNNYRPDVNDQQITLNQNAHNLITEILYLRKRLKQMGYTGDCAYEKKLSGYFTEIIKQYENELHEINKNN